MHICYSCFYTVQMHQYKNNSHYVQYTVNEVNYSVNMTLKKVCYCKYNKNIVNRVPSNNLKKKTFNNMLMLL